MRVSTESYSAPEPVTRRFRVIKTGDEGSAAAPNGLGGSIHRSISIGSRNNVTLIDLVDDETGEVRTYVADKLEEITVKA